MKKAFLMALASAALLGSGQAGDGLAKSWWDGDTLTGDWGGVRPALDDRGVEFSGSYIAEIWGNPIGGTSQEAVYTGILQFGATADLEKLVGWKGASINTSWLWLSGSDISANNVGNFFTVSNIAGFNTLRLLDLWFQQNLFDDKLSLRVGQLNADSDFVISNYGALFINSTFGWPAFVYMNTPNGGPAYPMGTLGARIAWTPAEWFSFQTAIFQGDVFAQNVNRHGFRWRLSAETGYLWMNEAQFRWNHQDSATGLPGQFKVGFWYDTADFTTVAPDSTTEYQGNYGLYGIVDQMLYREPSEAAVPASKDGKTVVDGKSAAKNSPPTPSTQGLGWFGRIAFSPPDRNYLSFYFDTGLSYQGLIPTRDSDTIGVAFAYGQLSPGTAQAAFDAGSREVGAEMVLEATYQVQVNNWLIVQPDVQYIINPGGSASVGNALVIGGRLSVTF